MLDYVTYSLINRLMFSHIFLFRYFLFTKAETRRLFKPLL